MLEVVGVGDVVMLPLLEDGELVGCILVGAKESMEV